MELVQLKEYLEIVIDMEKNIYLQNQVIDQLQNEISSLGKPKIFSKPDEPKKYTSGVIAIVLLCVIFGVIGILLLRWGIGILASDSLWSFIPGILVTLFGGIFVLGALVGAYSDISKELQEAQADKFNQAKYCKDLQVYNTNIKNDKQRVEQELVKKAALDANLEILKGQLERSKSNLRKIYDKNIIFPKYRNLIMLCSIYEYLCAGRCSTLEGHEGAYNILEMEIRFDRIITQLDRVLTRLSAIRQSQYILYSAIQDSNQRVASLVETTNSMAQQIENMSTQQRLANNDLQYQLNRLQESSAITAYQSERIERELSYMNRMNYISGNYNGTFFNLPPT